MILFSILSVVGIYYLNITYGFFNSISVSKYKTENYAVVVLKDSDYEELADLEGHDVGYYANQATSYQKANDLLLEKVDLSYTEYKEAFALGESLLDEEVDAIVIENSYQEIIEEQIEEFASSTKVIYTFSVEIETKLTAKDTKVTEEPFSIFISGSIHTEKYLRYRGETSIWWLPLIQILIKFYLLQYQETIMLL